jgi:hypothetical protein
MDNINNKHSRIGNSFHRSIRPPDHCAKTVTFAAWLCDITGKAQQHFTLISVPNRVMGLFARR